MSDPIAAAAAHAPAAPLLVFAAGLATAFGPCLAPRFLAVISIGSGSHRVRGTLAFVAGLVAAYALTGAAVSIAQPLIDTTAWFFGALAVYLIATGLWNVVRAGSCACPRTAPGRLPSGAGGLFLFGVSFAFIVSPCCTPIVAALAAGTSAHGEALYGAGLLALFGLGHSAPIALVGAGAGTFAGRLARASLHQATAVTGGALMVILGGYYACLA